MLLYSLKKLYWQTNSHIYKQSTAINEKEDKHKRIRTLMYKEGSVLPLAAYIPILKQYRV